MQVTVEFADAGKWSGKHQMVAVNRNADYAAAGDIGLSLEEAKHLLEAIQFSFVAAQAEELVERTRTCLRCQRRLPLKDVQRRHVQTLFGRIPVRASRLITCGCDRSRRRFVSPLKGWLGRCTNKLRYQAARWGANIAIEKQ